jgi:type VI secretion system protein ImpG
MLNQYYEQELNNLRTLAVEFGRRNPALAPLLGSAAAADADVERLLEGVAFLTGLVQQRLDDDFPEFTQTIAQLLYPHFLRPMPCMTMLRFQAQHASAGRIDVPAGTAYASIPVDGEHALFRSIMPVSIEPLSLISASWQRLSGKHALVLDMKIELTDPRAWKGDSLRLWLGGGLADAANLYRVLMRHVSAIEVAATDAPGIRLPAESLRAAGFDALHALVPWPAGAHPALSLLYDYFALPEKLLFIELTGLAAWTERKGDRFQVRLHLVTLPDWAPDLTDSSLVLHASPAINLYRHDAHPISVDHLQSAYRVQPLASDHLHRRIYSVESVRGRNAQGEETAYQPFSTLSPHAPAYQVQLKPSANGGGHQDYYLSFPYRDIGQAGRASVVSVSLYCTDGARPDGLRLGEIGLATDSSPARVGCANIMGVTPYREPPSDGTLLWRVLSHLNANHVTLANSEHLRDLLRLYLSWHRAGDHRQAANQRQIDAVQEIIGHRERRMVRGMAVEGTAIEVVCRGSHFAGPGSLFLFGAMLDEFFASCAAINTFTALTLRDSDTGEVLQWPAKVGRGRLM